MNTTIDVNKTQLGVDTKTFETGLARLQSEATSMVVKDAETCLAAKTMQRDARSYIKDVEAKLSPFVEAAKTNLARARDELNRWVGPAEAIDQTLAAKVKDYERREREAAEAEQRRINEENRRIAQEKADAERKEREKEIEKQRRAGEIGKREAAKLKEEAASEAKEAASNVQEVKVLPNIPTVAGVPSRRNWRFRIVDENKIPDRFWKLDEQYISAEVRRIKDKQKSEAEIPGIEAFLE